MATDLKKLTRFRKLARSVPLLVERRIGEMVVDALPAVAIEVGSDMIGWAGPGSLEDTLEYHAFPIDAAEEVAERTWMFATVDPDNALYLFRFRQPVSADEHLAYAMAQDALEEMGETTVRGDVKSYMAGVVKRPSAGTVKQFRYAPWFEFEEGGPRFAGVAVEKPRSGLVFTGMPYYAERAEVLSDRFENYDDPEGDPFEDVRAILGRYTLVGNPTVVSAYSFEGARQAALQIANMEFAQ